MRQQYSCHSRVKELALERDDVLPEYSDAIVQPAPASDSVLERKLSLSLRSIQAFVAVAALFVGTLLRYLDLDRWPLTAGEGAIALAARNLVEGLTVPDGMLGQPFVVEWTALFMFLGDTDGTVGRLSMATSGILVIGGLMLLYRWIGVIPALAAGILAAFSPTLIASSRSIDGGILLVLLSLATLIALKMSRERSGYGWPILTGIAGGLLFLSGPLSIPAIILVLVAFALLARPESIGQPARILAGIAAFVATVVLSGTVLFTRPDALPASLSDMVSILWNDHLLKAGDYWYLPFFNLILNEPLIIILSIIAVISGWREQRIAGLAIWSVAALILLSIVAGDGITAFGLTVLPFVILAAFGAKHLLLRIAELKTDRWQAAGYSLVIILLLFAFISVAGLASNDEPGRSTGETFVRFLLVLGIVIVPLGFILLKLGRSQQGNQILLLLVSIVVLFSGFTIRSAVLTASERPGEAAEILALGGSGEDLPLVIEQITKVSRDLTLNERTAEDATGGHGLAIAVDKAYEQPFAWYFRDFPNFTVFDPETEGIPEGTDVLIISDSEETEMPGMTGGEFVFAWSRPDLYTSPDWGSIAGGLVNPDSWRTFGDFLLNRDLSDPPVAERLQMLAVPAVSERLFASSGPYNLEDNAGAGKANGQFNQPRGIAVDENGMIYVVDAGNLRVQKFLPNGEFLLSFGDDPDQPGALSRFDGGGGGPGGVTIGSDGNVYVADTWNHAIQVYSPDGVYIRSWGTFFDAADDPEQSAENPGSFYGPRGIASHDGLIYVTDTGNERVQVFTEEGEFVRMFGLPGDGEGELREPVGIAVTPDGTVVVADSHNQRVSLFTLDGEPVDSWPVPAWDTFEYFEPYLAVGPDGSIYLSSSQTGEIAVYSESGDLIGIITSPEIQRPYGIAVTSDGTELLVTDGLSNSVVRVSSTPV